MQIDRKRLAHAVYDADDPISGDPIGALIDSDKPDDVCAIVVSTILADIEAQGFVVVPREPTLDMLQAGRDAVLRTRRYGVSGMSIEAQIRNECVREAAAWSAMIDAGKGGG